MNKMKTIIKKDEWVATPENALQLLIKGNERFVNNLKINRNLLQQANDTSDSQNPFAIILSCIDSRTGVEFIFDQGIGDVFSTRIAGNVINEDILGSMEFACLMKSKVIVVLGHTHCGAIKGACDDVKLGNLSGLLNKIKPAIEAEKVTVENRTSKNAAFVENITAIHVKNTVKAIASEEHSSLLNEMIKTGECGIIGGIHNISTGQVHFYKDTMLGFFGKKSKVSIEPKTENLRIVSNL